MNICIIPRTLLGSNDLTLMISATNSRIRQIDYFLTSIDQFSFPVIQKTALDIFFFFLSFWRSLSLFSMQSKCFGF